MQSVSFTKTIFEQPEDGQNVWLLRDGETVAVPARYEAKTGNRAASFSLLDSAFSYGHGSSWAPMEIPHDKKMTG